MDVSEGGTESSSRNVGLEDRFQGKSNKNISRMIENQFIVEGSGGDDSLVAKNIMREAMRLAGVDNFEPTMQQVKNFMEANDSDGDGKIGPRDIEERVNFYNQNEPMYVSNTRSSRSIQVSASDRSALRKSANEKMGDKISDALINECKRRYSKYVKQGEGYVEYEQLIPVLADIYSLIGFNFKPSSNDIRKYIELIDVDRDGVISWGDLEQYVLKIIVSFENTSG